MPILKTQKQEYLCEVKAKLVYKMSAKSDGITKWVSKNNNDNRYPHHPFISLNLTFHANSDTVKSLST